MKPGSLPRSSFFASPSAVFVACSLVVSPALAEPRLAQSEPTSSSEQAGAAQNDSTWFEAEGTSAEDTSPPAAPEPAEKQPEPKAPAARSAERSGTLIVVDRGTTEQPPPSRPSWRRHDGLYLRLSMGAGGLGAQTTREDGAIGFEAGSGSSAFDFMLGGTPTPGLTLGGGFHLDIGHGDPEADEQMEGDRRGARDVLFMAGPFIDVYPNPRGGFHLGGMLGGAGLAHSESVEGEPMTYRGVGGSVWLGYDWWVARQWSLGAMLRGSSARLEGTDPVQREVAQAGSVALLFTVLYH